MGARPSKPPHYIMSFQNTDHRLPHYHLQTEYAWATLCLQRFNATPVTSAEYWPNSIRYWRASRQIHATLKHSWGMRYTTKRLLDAQATFRNQNRGRGL